MLKRMMIAAAVLLAGCTPTPRQDAVTAPPTAKPACRAGADAKGIAAGFFSLFTDDLSGCL